MNHDAPRQRIEDSRWDYTSSNPRYGTHPIGYCRPWSDPREWEHIPEPEREREHARLAPFQDRYHTDGHETAEEACACYKAYLLDLRLRLRRWESEEPPQTLYLCAASGCGEHTAHRADVGGLGPSWPLCEIHLNRETVSGLLTVGESWHS